MRCIAPQAWRIVVNRGNPVASAPVPLADGGGCRVMPQIFFF
jgi:hypothetical protein